MWWSVCLHASDRQVVSVIEKKTITATLTKMFAQYEPPTFRQHKFPGRNTNLPIVHAKTHPQTTTTTNNNNSYKDTNQISIPRSVNRSNRICPAPIIALRHMLTENARPKASALGNHHFELEHHMHAGTRGVRSRCVYTNHIRGNRWRFQHETVDGFNKRVFWGFMYFPSLENLDGVCADPPIESYPSELRIMRLLDIWLSVNAVNHKSFWKKN